MWWAQVWCGNNIWYEGQFYRTAGTLRSYHLILLVRLHHLPSIIIIITMPRDHYHPHLHLHLLSTIPIIIRISFVIMVSLKEQSDRWWALNRERAVPSALQNSHIINTLSLFLFVCLFCWLVSCSQLNWYFSINPVLYCVILLCTQHMLDWVNFQQVLKYLSEELLSDLIMSGYMICPSGYDWFYLGKICHHQPYFRKNLQCLLIHYHKRSCWYVS